MKLGIADHIQRQLFWHNGYETEEINIICTMLQPGDNFLDAGANIGNHSLHAAQQVKAELLSRLSLRPKRLNNLTAISLNNFSNIITVKMRCQIKRESKTLFIKYRKHWQLGLSASDEFSGETVEVTTITGDEWLQQNFNNSIAGIKIDVEGHELEVLKGLQQRIGRDKPFVMIEILKSTPRKVWP